MRNALYFTAVFAMIAGGISAQSMDDVLKLMEKHDSSGSAESVSKAPAAQPGAKGSMVQVEEEPAAEETPATEAPVVQAEEQPIAKAPMVQAEEEPTAEAPMIQAEKAPATEAQVDQMVEENRQRFLNGEFDKAKAGFEQVVKIAPENKMARMYLKSLLERKDQQKVAARALKAVDEAWSTDMTLRSYPLADGAREKMDLQDVTSAVDVEALFPQVPFPKGASAIYQPSTDILFVRNTYQNLEELELILEGMEVLKDYSDAEQVEIESQFVEVSEGTLEELGFQWNFNGPVGVNLGGTELDVNDGSGGLFSGAQRGSPTGASPTLPFSQTPQGDGVLPASGGWGTFRLQDNFSTLASSLTLQNRGKTPVDIIISALNQNSGANVLSAPRVVTRNGEEATIRVGELHSYPEVYEGDSSQGTIVHVAYEDFEEKLLGIEMTVTPEVDDDQIQLELNPRITELVGWQSYQLAPANSIYNYRQTGYTTAYEHDAIMASLPIYKKREIETVVNISDGSTIGMGGLINEKIENFEDKVPVLGSIPLLGRLFRHEGERSVKRNLLIFVTAKKVSPSGQVDTSRSFE